MGKMQPSTLLIWVGPDAYPGWPACDHEEEDPALYEAKLASGLYQKPGEDRQAELEAERRAAKALANAQAAKAAKRVAEEAEAIAERAQQEAADRKANAGARLAAAQRTVKEAEHGQG